MDGVIHHTYQSDLERIVDGVIYHRYLRDLVKIMASAYTILSKGLISNSG